MVESVRGHSFCFSNQELLVIFFSRVTKTKEDPTGRFHIGETFKVAAPPAETPVEPTLTRPDSDIYCKLCNISVTSKPQMKLHLEGSKHAKKLQRAG